MSTSLTYTSFVVAGAGSIGSLTASELLAIPGTRVTVLTRGGNTKIPAGATERIVDYGKPEELVKALKDVGAEVVISTLSGPGFASQIPLADAALEAGVKLFVPSEFGSISHEAPSPGPFDAKNAASKHLKAIGFPYTIFYIGVFADLPFTIFPSVLDVEKHTLTVAGTGNVKVSFTTRPDIARYVAHVLTHSTPSALSNTIIGIEAEKLTWRELAKIYEKKYNAPFEVKLRDVEQVQKELPAKGHAGFVDYIQLIVERGLADVEKYKKPELYAYEEWKPMSVEAAVQKYYP
ncbi:NAD(P)-binding protein [Exidia glandulosa HHB12029]|uniref:NAD(P)-binding protein n=1 Tax=Exidia glandulosa HHB12029 TaxID=1314781 RepID=A0A165IVB9_EXIGL|nr:NAD(P)-binding protein [Exidia glandulosa HHB12029]